MRKICFICLGNVCRSPMAEFIMKDLIKKENRTDIEVTSRAISYEEAGNDMDTRAKETLERNHIPFTKHLAKRIEKEEKYDEIYVMEEYQISYVKEIVGEAKIKRLQDYDIEDPWYTNHFQKVYEQILDGCKELFNKMKL